MIESTWLRAFAVFAEDANLSRTARRLHLSQPAVHAQLRRLGGALGVTLYVRAGRGLALTAQGIEVAAFARDLDERTHHLEAKLRGDALDGPIVLAAGAGAILYVIGEGLRAFTKRGESRLDLRTLDAPAALDAVRAGLAHVAVAATDAPPSDLESHILTTVDQVLVVPRAHRLAARRRVTLDDLAGERLVLPPEGRPQRVALDALLRARGAEVEVGAIARGWELTVKLAELGLGLAIVNGCCHVPKGLVTKPLDGLPAIHYRAVHRAGASERTRDLVRALVARGDAWRERVARRTSLTGSAPRPRSTRR